MISRIERVNRHARMPTNYYQILGPLLRTLPPEAAHNAAVTALRCGLVPRSQPVDDTRLRMRVFGVDFPNPVGMAAGFDKNAEVVVPLLKQGFGFVEVGTVTPRAQPGNDKPRMRRLPADQAIINRLGFNNHGAEPMAARLDGWRTWQAKHRGTCQAADGIVGLNIGKNKDSTDATADYALLAETLGHYADYVVINVSSPNTKGLRLLQNPKELRELIAVTHAALTRGCQSNSRATAPLLVKIAPDITAVDAQDIASVILDSPIDGLVVSNTTIDRPTSLRSPHRHETGGLSGAPLFAPSTAVLHDMYRLTQGRVPIVGVGGVGSALQAYEKIKAGASLVQLYTALIYQGMGLVNQIQRELGTLLERDGFADLAAAVGAAHRVD